MAAGSAGEVAIPAMGDPDEVLNMRATMERMMDSIIIFPNQMAELLEDPEQFFTRIPDASSGERGPAVRERVYSYAQQSDRTKMHDMEEVINTSTSRINELEVTLAFLSLPAGVLVAKPGSVWVHCGKGPPLPRA